MKIIKKGFCFKTILSMAAAVILFNTGVVEAASLRDINQSSDYAKASIIALAESNIISGDHNSDFHPRNTVTRAEMVKLIIMARGIDVSVTPDAPTFKDVPKTHWAFPYVEAAYKHGIIQGVTADMFGAKDKCTREQMATMFVRSTGLNNEGLKDKQDYFYVNGLNDPEEVSDWAKDYVEFAMMSGLMNGKDDGVFGAGDFAERQQAAVLIHRFITGKDKIQKIVRGYQGSVDKYPELFNALIDSKKSFKGKVGLNMLMEISDPTMENDPINMQMKADGLVDQNELDVKYLMSLGSAGDDSVLDQQFRVIVKDGSAYIQEEENGLWISVPESELQLGQIFSGDSSIEGVLRFYLNTEIIKTGTVDLNGTTATKYTIPVNADTLNGLLNNTPMGLSDQQLELLKQAFESISGNVEYYLDSKNQIIKQTIEFSASIADQESGFAADIDFNMDVNLTMLPSVEISAPRPEEIDHSTDVEDITDSVTPF